LKNAVLPNRIDFSKMKNQLWHILIIDDSPDDRADLRQMLLRGSDRRYRFSEAELGADGLRQLQQTREGPYDCILLDYCLPDMNAEELLAAFCAGADLPPCPVVVVTGSGRADGPRLLRAGAQDYIGKDWTTPESLTRTVANSRERFALLADRAEAREVLRIERERLDLALTYGNMGIYEWHMVDDRLWWSAELYRVFGVTPETFIPTRDTFSALLHPADRDVFWQHVAESIAQHQPFLHEFRIVPPDGKVRWIADRGRTEYDAEGRGLRHFGVAFDVTEGKVAEAKLIEAKVAAEIANNAKSDFLSSMSHELRTPLHAILGFAQLIDLASPPPTPAQKRSIDQVLKAGWHLLGLINEVLDLALIESGKLSLSMEPVALAEVLRDCEAMVEPEAKKHGISVAFAPFEAGCSVDADPTRVETGDHQPAVQRNQVQQTRRRGLPDVHPEPARVDAYQRSRYRRGTGPRAAGATLPAIQSSGSEGAGRRRYGHRPGGLQEAGGCHERQDWR
jgi:CheY-like chemotaxis protein